MEKDDDDDDESVLFPRVPGERLYRLGPYEAFFE